MICLVQLARAVRAAGRLDVDLALAEGANLGGGIRRLLFLLLDVLGRVHRLDDQEQHEGRDDEADDRADKGSDRRTGSPGAFRQVNGLGQDSIQQGLDEVGDQGVNDGLEGSTDDDTDSHVDSIATFHKCAEFF